MVSRTVVVGILEIERGDFVIHRSIFSLCRVEIYLGFNWVVAVFLAEGKLVCSCDNVVEKHSKRTEGDERWNW